MEDVSAAAPQRLSLPEEFVLLSHLPDGRVHGKARAVIGAAAAELGELALRGRLAVRAKKTKVFGFEGYQMHGVDIELLDTTLTGLAWADALLAELGEQCAASGGSRVRLNRWFRRHHGAFALHRDALAARGLLRPGGRAGLFTSRLRHHPDPGLREALVADVGAARSGQAPLDAHMLFLVDLTETVRLREAMGIRHNTRWLLDRARGIGTAAAVPEEMRDTSAALAARVPSNDNDRQYGRPRL
ncbi:hypothetical protein DVA86_20920 [Streptomyces armeniacus]|uniref:GPP34 family phosphoprotein n=1 Tax=Streptomyces armeniacus TaxID=83291 RepID=A0A345XSY1_9ACTN|nr:GPP34 family phosphoprotein [Streptomyces armeniacus]AXK34747.1 hypothetical protein DVA86_20920 [Streptomyces armeniacus]